MRILMLVDESLTTTAEETVVERWRALMPLLDSTDQEILLVTLRHRGLLYSTMKALGYDVESLECRTNHSLPLAVVRLHSLLGRDRFDLLHAHETLPALVAGLASTASGTVCVYDRRHTWGGRRLNLASRVASVVTDYTVGGSRAVIDFAQSLDRREPSKVLLVHDGVPSPRPVTQSETDSLKAALGIPETSQVVEVIARLRAEKGLDHLVAAMELVAERLESRPHLVIVGDGPDRARLEARQREASFPMHLVGHQGDIAPWFAIADVVAAPSLREAFGFAAVEAMACGKPLVASRVGGLSEIVVHGGTGLLVPPGDAPALAEGIIELLTNDVLHRRMGEAAAKRYGDQFTLEKMVTRWELAWQEILSGHDSSSKAYA